jgi:hypothetical protein
MHVCNVRTDVCMYIWMSVHMYVCDSQMTVLVFSDTRVVRSMRLARHAAGAHRCKFPVLSGFVRMCMCVCGSVWSIVRVRVCACVCRVCVYLLSEWLRWGRCAGASGHGDGDVGVSRVRGHCRLPIAVQCGGQRRRW